MDLINNYNIKLLDTPISGFTGDTNSRKIEACLVNLLGVRAIDKDVYLILTANLPNGGFAEWTQTPDEEGKYLITLDNAIYTVAGITSLTITAKKNNQIKTAMVLHIKVDNSKLISLSTSKPIEKPLKDADTVDGRHASDFILKGSGIKQGDLSPELLQQMAGNTPINSIPQDGSVTLAKLSGEVRTLKDDSIKTSYLQKSSVTPDKTSFFMNGTNKFNKDTALDDNYVRTADGVVTTLSGFYASDYIDVIPGSTITIKKARNYGFYDKNKVYISGVTASPDLKILTVPSGAAFIRFSTMGVDLPKEQNQVNDGGQLLEFEPYKRYIPVEFQETQQINPVDFANKLLSFLSTGKNLFDPSKKTVDYYVNQTNGELNVNTSYEASDFIAVKPATYYSLSDAGSPRIAFYNSNKVFISGLNSPANPILTPSNTAFLRFSYLKNGKAMLEEGKEVTANEPFGYKFKQELPSAEPIIPDINLPSKIYAVAGKELDIYYDNLLNDKDTKFNFDITCNIGEQWENFFRVKPVTPGTYSFKLDVYKDGVIKITKTSDIIVSSADAGSGVTRKITIIGDSTTDNPDLTAKLNENFKNDVMKIVLQGTRGTGSNRHDAVSGWNADLFNKASDGSTNNPFWNPNTSAFDYSYYVSKNGFTSPDYIIINLGINDVFNYKIWESTLEPQIQNVFRDIDKMIASIKTYNSSIKIGIAITIPPSYSQDSFGRSYKNGQTRWIYKQTNFKYVKALISKFKDRESEKIYLVPIHASLDTRYNFPKDFVTPSIPVNARNRDNQMMVNPAANAGVHPGEGGYHQIADVYHAWLKSFEN